MGGNCWLEKGLGEDAYGNGHEKTKPISCETKPIASERGGRACCRAADWRVESVEQVWLHREALDRSQRAFGVAKYMAG